MRAISDEEFDDRLLTKLRGMQLDWLVTTLMTEAYDAMSELFNNEILEEWEAEQADDDEP